MAIEKKVKVDKATKEQITKGHREARMLRNESVKHPKSGEIDAKIKEMIGAGTHTFEIKLALVKEFKITLTIANDHVRHVRQKMKIYNYGDNKAKEQEKKKFANRNFYIHDDKDLISKLDKIAK